MTLEELIEQLIRGAMIRRCETLKALCNSHDLEARLDLGELQSLALDYLIERVWRTEDDFYPRSDIPLPRAARMHHATTSRLFGLDA